MKQLVAGMSIVLPDQRIHPFQSSDVFASHGDFVYARTSVIPPLQNGYSFGFVLKVLGLVDYQYGPFSNYEINALTLAFHFGVPYNRLTGGEVYNVYIRPRLYAVNGTPIL